METLRQLLEHKGQEVWTITPEASVYDGVARMAELGIGALPVVSDGALVGIITERDYARKIVLEDRSSRTTAISTIMTRTVVCTDPGQTVRECMELMTERRFRHLPVVEDGRLVGLVSVGDLVKSVISDQQFVIRQLESYIHGEAPAPAR